MGYESHDPKTAINTNLGSVANTSYAFYTNSSGKINKHEINDSTFTDKYGETPKEGDIVTMRIDFDALSLSYSINDKDYGKAFTIKKSKYRAAVSLYYKNASIELC